MINVDALLMPISTDNPVGIDIREKASKEYAEAKTARLSARNQERDALHDEEAGKDLGLWRKVIELCSTLLQQQSKDLTLAVWLTEGLIRVDGFAGLHQGITLLHGLLKQYWPVIYPAEDEEGIETKLIPLLGLNGEHGEGTLIAPINSIPLTKGSSLSAAAWQYQQALSYSNVTDPDKLKKLLKSGIVTLEQINQSIAETPLSYLQTLEEELQNCLSAFDELNQLLNQICTVQQAPPTSNIVQGLRFCLELVQGFIRKLKPAVNKIEQNNTGQELSTEHNSSQNKLSLVNHETINSKEQAFSILLNVADFFRGIEPQSPVSYLLEQAIRLGNLSLPELLSELIPDNQMLEYSYRMIGIQQYAAEDNEKD